MKYKRFFLAIVIFSLFLLPWQTSAQGVDTSVDLSIEMVPLNPAAGATVTLTAQSFSIDLNQTTLSWSYGGKAIGAGTGKTSISVIAPASGQVALASVTVSGGGIASTSASVLLNPGSVDMLWEASDSYTPPFYKGKPLLPPGGIFRVVAIPSASAPRQVAFNWARNDSAVQSASGLGQSSITLQNTVFNKTETVNVAVAGGLFQGNGTISIVPQNPSVIAYQKKEGFIDYATGGGSTLSVSGSGTVLHFEPFFFSVPRTITDDLSFEITVGGEVISDQPSNEVRISSPDTGGNGTVNVKVGTTQYSLQNIARQFTLLFN